MNNIRTIFILITFLTVGDVSGQSKYVFKIKKREFDSMDTIVPCHNKLFYSGSLGSTKPNLDGFGYHYHSMNLAWLDFNASKFYLVRDTGTLVTENHENGHLYWLESDLDLYEKDFDLHSFKTDSTDGSWEGKREDTLSRKEVVKTTVTLNQCDLIMTTIKGYYDRDYLYSYPDVNKRGKEIKRWVLTFKNPKITWVQEGDSIQESFEKQLPIRVLEPYKLDEL